MALTEETKNDKIEVVQLAAGYPVIQVRTATIIKRDDVEISRSFHRRVVTPGDDFLAEPDADVLAIIRQYSRLSHRLHTLLHKEANNDYSY